VSSEEEGERSTQANLTTL